LQQKIKKITNIYLTKHFALCEFDFRVEGFWLAPKLCRWGWDLYED